ncbi:hypothetical protein V5O48_017261, partial [Marasmius crinis-equi]
MPSYGFAVTGLPDQVTQGQIAKVTWFREESGPTNFMLAKTTSAVDAAGLIVVTSVEQNQKSGTMRVAFGIHRLVSVAAYDLSRVESNAILFPMEPRPTFFFVDDQHPISIVPAGFQLSTAPATTTSASILNATALTTQSAHQSASGTTLSETTKG